MWLSSAVSPSREREKSHRDTARPGNLSDRGADSELTPYSTQQQRPPTPAIVLPPTQTSGPQPSSRINAQAMRNPNHAFPSANTASNTATAGNSG